MLRCARVRRALGAAATLTVVGAQAISGIGVREAAVLATRGAAERARRLVETKGLSAVECGSMAPEALLAKLKSLPAEGFDDSLLARILPKALVRRAKLAAEKAERRAKSARS